MRINIIHPSLLSDVHLRAEYKEILMIFNYYKRSNNSKKGIDYSLIPKSYTLNKGHATFFYNKFKFIYYRYFSLHNIMVIRGFKTREYNKFNELYNIIPEENKNDYSITKEDIYINVERLLQRIYIKETGFYKLNKKNLCYDEWKDYYTNKLNLDKEKISIIHNKIVLDFDNGLLTKHLKGD